MLNATFPRKKRMTNRKSFVATQKYGLRQHGKFLTLIAEPARPLGSSGTLGLTVSKKVGLAHERNLIKRRLRHIFRTHQELFSQTNIVMIAKQEMVGCSFSCLVSDVLSAFQKVSTQIKNPKGKYNFKKQMARKNNEHPV